MLGGGRRLFPEGAYASLKLVESVATTTGVVLAAYRRNVIAVTFIRRQGGGYR